MVYAPAKEFNHDEEHIDSEVKPIDWWWNEQICQMNLVIATMILTILMATATALTYDSPFIQYI